jgi:hypothetical protein
MYSLRFCIEVVGFLRLHLREREPHYFMHEKTHASKTGLQSATGRRMRWLNHKARRGWGITDPQHLDLPVQFH